MFRNCCSSRMVFIWTVLVGLLFVGSLVLAFWGMPKIIISQIHAQTRLENGTEQWDRFVKLPFPLDYSIRFLNVENPDQVVNNTEKPRLNETDPYTYKVNIEKVNIRSDDMDEDSVTYERRFTFTFDETGTTKETDKVTIINPVLMSALQLTSGLNRLALGGCIKKILGPAKMDRIFITKTVRELLFDGVKFADANDNIGVACTLVRKKMIQIVKGIRVIEHITEGGDYLKLAMINYKTPSYTKERPDGIYTINRGNDDMSALGDILRWNGQTRITKFGNAGSMNDTCQQIKGTDSTIYSPGIESGQQLTIFNTDICRTVNLFYVNSDETYQGIKAYRFETSKSIFRPSTIVPENDCYCSKGTQDVNGNDYCYLDGLFDLKPCLGAPILVSQPHFLNADESYLNNVENLSPNASKHGIYLLIEPNTGTPLEGMKRIQMNSVLRQQKFLSMITPKTMHQGVVPFLWVEEGFSLPTKYVDVLNEHYFSKVKLATGLKYGLIGVFAALLAGCIFIVWRKNCFKNKYI